MSVLDFFNPKGSAAGSLVNLFIEALNNNTEAIKALTAVLNGSVIGAAFDPIVSAIKSVEDAVALVETAIKAFVPFTCLIPLFQQVATAWSDLDNVKRDLEIQGPNLDKDAARELARVLAVPLVGDVVKNEVNLAWLDRYQRITGRGFPTALDQLHYMVSGGITPASLISEVSARVPEFFLDNENDIRQFNKGYKSAIRSMRP